MATFGEDLDLSAAQLIEQYGARRLSPLDATREVLHRIEHDDGVVNAFCLVDGERALGEARGAEARWFRGNPRGALDGVPVGIKDVLLTRGWPTLRGSRAVERAGPWDHDAPSVASLRRAGAVIVGKTTTPEVGWKAVTDSPLEGVTRNPWDPSRTSGGSSGGSAAALASGMVPLAIGTDGGGSIRIPCAFCGVVGLKPTYGRVPIWPASPFGDVSHCGPMARTVDDLAVLLDVLSQPDVRDWTALPAPTESFRERLEDGVRGLRVAFSADLGHAIVDVQVAELVERSAHAFANLGASVDLVEALFPDPREAFEILWSVGAARAARDLGDPPEEQLDPGFVATMAIGRRHTIEAYFAAIQRRDELGMQMSAFHQDWDLLITPSVPITAFAADREVPEDWPDERWPSWTPFTYPFNLTQQPTASVPCGFSSDGLPVGLQIVGPRYRDSLVLRAAKAYETACPQPTQIPHDSRLTGGADGTTH